MINMSKANSSLSLPTVAAVAPALLPVVAVVGGGVLLQSWMSSDDKPKPANGDTATTADTGGVPTTRRIGMFRQSTPARVAAPMRPQAVPMAEWPAIVPAPRPRAPMSGPAPSLSLGNPIETPRSQEMRSRVTADDVRTELASGPHARAEATAALCRLTAGRGRSTATSHCRGLAPWRPAAEPGGGASMKASQIPPPHPRIASCGRRLSKVAVTARSWVMSSTGP